MVLTTFALNINAQEHVPAAKVVPSGPNVPAGNTPAQSTISKSDSDFVKMVTDSVERDMNRVRKMSDELMTYVRSQELTPQRRAVADSMAEVYHGVYERVIAYIKQELENHRESPECAQLINRFQRPLGLDYIPPCRPARTERNPRHD